MSDREPENGHSARLLRALIWAGVGLAPVAALVGLVGGDGPERFAVVLVAVCVVLLGAALLIRSDPVLLRMHVEDRVAEEISVLREELRSEFAAARTPAPAAPGLGAPGPAAPRTPSPAAPGLAVPGPVPHIVPQLPRRTAPSIPQAARDPFTGAVRAASNAGHGGGRAAVGAVAKAGVVTGGRAGVPDQGPASSGRAGVPDQDPALRGRGGVPDRGPASSGRAGVPGPGPASGGRSSGYATGLASGGRAGDAARDLSSPSRIASAPGWPDQRPAADAGPAADGGPAADRGPAPDTARSRPHPGRADRPEPGNPRRPASGGRAAVAAASVPATGGAAVPGQRAHSTGLVRPPIAPAIPVFRPPAPASPAPSRTTGEAYGTPRRSAAEGTYGRPVAEQTGRRRADETAVDIGYTGRRSKPDHAAEESQYADWTDAEPGWSDGESGAGWHDGGSGAGWNDGHRAAGPSDGESDARWHDGEPDAAWHGGERGVRWNDGERDVRWNDGERDVRSNGGERDARWHDGERDGAWHDGERGVRWHDGESDARWRDGGPGAGWAGAEPEPGYSGWAEADERYGTEWRGRERTGGW